MREPVFNETLQLGIVVRDLGATMRRYVDDYGVGPWEVYEFDAGKAEDFREYGQPVERSWRLAVATVGQVQWELIEPLDEESVYARFLAEKDEGVHHVAVATPDFDETVAQATRGNGVILSGEFAGARVAYLGTDRDLGVVIEIFSGTLRTVARTRAAPDARMGPCASCRTWVGDDPNAAINLRFPHHLRELTADYEGAPAMSLARVQNISISLDGFATGEGQSLDAPFGHAGERLHEWMFATRWGREMLGQPGGTGGIDDAFSRLFAPGIGAEIMGAGKFGPPGWHEDPEWKGAWGPNPPFHTPVFVLTHHPRPSIEMEGGTTFHFIDASRAEALETAREAADGQDVRIGGGPTMIRDFLAARLVDHMHIVVVPILLGRGVRLWDGLEGLEKDYQVEAASSPSGVTHVTFTRAGV